MIADFRWRFWLCAIATVPILLLSPGVPLAPPEGIVHFPGSEWVALALCALVYGVGAWPFLRGMRDELAMREPGMMTLVAVATTVAFVYSAATVFGAPGMGFFWELATLVDVMLLGHWVEMASVMHAGSAIEALARLLPARAHRLGAPGAAPIEVPLETLRPGDLVLVRPGERIPADGRVTAGDSEVDESLLTGESMPVRRAAGDEVLGGALNGGGALTVEITRTGADAFLAQVADLVRSAEASRSRAQRLADRAARWLTLVALGGGVLTGAAWLAVGAGVAYALERTVTVMVIACPHALGLAVPLVVARTSAMGARRGLLVRDRSAFELLRDVRVVVFDKTGTLTEGRFGVEQVLPLGSWTAEKLLTLVASVEVLSEHPIARALAAAVPASALRPATDFRALPGSGVQATVDGHHVHLRAARWAPDPGSGPELEELESLQASGRTVIAVSVDSELAGGIALADRVRPEAAEAVRRLAALGVRCALLSGDARAVSERVAGELGIESVFAEVRPADKAAVVASIREESGLVAMVGDGVNDAPALVSADIGVAIGAGADVAVESADVVLVRSDPRDVAYAIELSRAAYGKMRENLWWAAGYNAIAIPLAAGVLGFTGIVLGPAFGAALMSVSTVIVALNAQGLRVSEREAATA